jgi:hypothetical protein
LFSFILEFGSINHNIRHSVHLVSRTLMRFS